jgi:hypothetical protein
MFQVVSAGFWCGNVPHEWFPRLQTTFAQLRIGLVGDGGTERHIWPTEMVEIATLCEFDETSLSPVTHIWVTLSDFFTLFTLK